MITAQKAWQAVEDWDWPGAMAFNPAGFSNALVWLPFEPKTGRNAVSPALKELASLRLPAAVCTHSLPKPSIADTLVPATTQAASLRIPCWVFANFPPGAMVLLERSSDRAEPYWAVVEATSGAVLGGRLPASRMMANLRLWSLVCMLLIGMSIGLGLMLRVLKWPAEWVRNCVVGGAMDARTLIGVPAVLAALGYIAWKRRPSFASTLDMVLGKGLPTWLIEPAMRSDRAEIRLPVDQRWREILRVSGWLMLASLVPQFIFMGVLLSVTRSFQTGLFVISVFCGFLAAALAIHRSRAVEGAPASPPTEGYRGPASVLVESVLRVTVLAMAGLAVGCLIFYLGVMLGSDYLIGRSTSYVTSATHFGALIGSALVPARGRARITLSLGVIAGWFLGVYLNDWMTLLGVAAVVIAASLRPSQGPSDTVPRRLFLAARGAWSYSLGAAIGRMGGRVLGGLIMGPLGAIVGETMGEPVLAAFGWLNSQQERE